MAINPQRFREPPVPEAPPVEDLEAGAAVPVAVALPVADLVVADLEGADLVVAGAVVPVAADQEVADPAGVGLAVLVRQAADVEVDWTLSHSGIGVPAIAASTTGTSCSV